MKGSYFFYVKKVEILPVFVDRSIPDENKRQQELASLLRAKDSLTFLMKQNKVPKALFCRHIRAIFVIFCVKIVKFCYFS